MNLRQVAMLGGVALSMVGAAPAMASDYDFYYGSTHVARLTATGGTDFSFSFLAAPDPDAFINDILLDMGSGLFTNTTGASVTVPTYSFKDGGYEGTDLQTKVSFPNPNNPAEGYLRLTIGETATWTITGAFDGPARLHVNAFIGDKSVKLVSVIPEPEAYLLALAALGVLGVARQHRRTG